MKTYQELITELFDNPAPYKVIVNKKDHMETKFMVDDITYFMYIVLDDWMPADEMDDAEDIKYNVSFASSSTGSQADSTIDITGTGNAATVFSTVMTIVKKHYSQYRKYVSAYVFSAKEPSRVRLYKTIAERMKKELRFKTVSKYRDSDGDTVFEVKRN